MSPSLFYSDFISSDLNQLIRQVNRCHQEVAAGASYIAFSFDCSNLVQKLSYDGRVWKGV